MIGMILRNMRKIRGLTQVQIGKKLNLAENTISIMKQNIVTQLLIPLKNLLMCAILIYNLLIRKIIKPIQ